MFIAATIADDNVCVSVSSDLIDVETRWGDGSGLVNACSIGVPIGVPSTTDCCVCGATTFAQISNIGLKSGVEGAVAVPSM